MVENENRSTERQRNEIMSKYISLDEAKWSKNIVVMCVKMDNFHIYCIIGSRNLFYSFRLLL